MGWPQSAALLPEGAQDGRDAAALILVAGVPQGSVTLLGVPLGPPPLCQPSCPLLFLALLVTDAEEQSTLCRGEEFGDGGGILGVVFWGGSGYRRPPGGGPSMSSYGA